MKKKLLTFSICLGITLGLFPLTQNNTIYAAMKKHYQSTQAETNQAKKLLETARNNVLNSNYSAAIDLYSKCIANDRTLGVYAERAYCRYMLGDIKNAKIDANTAIQQHYIKDGTAELLYARCFFAEADYLQASKYYTAAMSKNLFIPDLQYAAMCFEKTNRPVNATPYYLLLLACNPNDEYALKGLENVREILKSRLNDFKERKTNPIFIEPEGFSQVPTVETNNINSNTVYSFKEYNKSMSDPFTGIYPVNEGSVTQLVDEKSKMAQEMLNEQLVDFNAYVVSNGKEAVSQIIQNMEDYNIVNNGELSFGEYCKVNVLEKYDDSNIKSWEKLSGGSRLGEVADQLSQIPSSGISDPVGTALNIYDDVYHSKEESFLTKTINDVLSSNGKLSKIGTGIASIRILDSIAGRISSLKELSNLVKYGAIGINGTDDLVIMINGKGFLSEDAKKLLGQIIDKDIYIGTASNSTFFRRNGYPGVTSWMEDHSGEFINDDDSKPVKYNYNGSLIYFKSHFSFGLENTVDDRIHPVSRIIRLDKISGNQWGTGGHLQLRPIWNDKIQRNGNTNIDINFNSSNISISYCGKTFKGKTCSFPDRYIAAKDSIYGYIEAMTTVDGIIVSYKNGNGSPIIQIKSHNFEKGFHTFIYGNDAKCNIQMYY